MYHLDIVDQLILNLLEKYHNFFQVQFVSNFVLENLQGVFLKQMLQHLPQFHLLIQL